jgi:phospholipase C
MRNINNFRLQRATVSNSIVALIALQLGDGFRVPALVISPYSRSGVNHTMYDTTSLLKLLEKAFGLASLTARDGSSNTRLECFDFSETPLTPLVITRDTELDFSKLEPTKP